MSGDPLWSQVKGLYINDNATNGSTSFADQSTVGATITNNGSNCSYTNVSPPTGMTTTAQFGNGVAGLYLTVANAGANVTFFTGAFTVEWMAYYHSFGSDSQPWGRTGNQIVCLVTPTNVNAFWQNANRISGGVPSVDTWEHEAITREAGTQDTKLWRAGSQVGSTATFSDNVVANDTQTIGTDGGSHATRTPLMRLCCIRITIGTARYTTTFTPPTLPLPSGPVSGGPFPYFDHSALAGGLANMRRLVRDTATGLLLPRPGLILPKGC